MPDYSHMYAIFCAAASQALDRLPDTPEYASRRELLQNALLEAEEIYLVETDRS